MKRESLGDFHGSSCFCLAPVHASRANVFSKAKEKRQRIISQILIIFPPTSKSHNTLSLFRLHSQKEVIPV